MSIFILWGWTMNIDRFYSNCYTLTSSNVVMSHFADAKCCNKYIAPINVNCNTNRIKVKQSLIF